MKKTITLLVIALLTFFAGALVLYFLLPAKSDTGQTFGSEPELAAQADDAPQIKPKTETEETQSLIVLDELSLNDGTVWHPLLSNGGMAEFSILDDGEREDILQISMIKPSFALAWDIQLFRENISLSQDFKQKLAAWVKGPVGTEIMFSVEAPNYHLIQNKHVILVGKWQKVVFEFITDEAEIRTAMHFSYPHNEAATILIDDIQVEASL